MAYTSQPATTDVTVSHEGQTILNRANLEHCWSLLPSAAGSASSRTDVADVSEETQPEIRRVPAALDGAFLRQAALTLEEELHALAAAKQVFGGDSKEPPTSQEPEQPRKT
jgi:hypothetical protein